LIEKVINTNKLRKIDDTIKKTIMIKLNGETVKLTSEVNELRKEKKNLISKTKQLQLNIKDIRTHFTEKNVKENANSITEFVPGNISAIRSENSKHQSPKLLPFQLYHQNKPSQRTSIHSKMQAKSIAEENSTQLPSIIKNSQSYSGSIF
jgi:regulator of replication initiation timing